MAADTVQGVQNLPEEDAGLYAALAGPQTFHMVDLALAGELADLPLHFRHALQLVQMDILMIEGGDGPVKELAGIVVDDGQLRHGPLGVINALFILLLRQVQQMLGVVADALQIGKGLEYVVDVLGVPVGHFLYVEFDQKIADGVGQIVDDRLVFLNLLGVGHPARQQSPGSQIQVRADQTSHALHLIADLQQGDAGGAYQIYVDVFQTAGVLVLLLGHQQVGELDHLIGQRQQHRGGDHLEDDMHHGHLEHGVRHNAFNKLGIRQEQGDGGHDDGAHQIVDQIDHGGPLGVVPGVHGGQDRGHGGADVDAADQEGGEIQRHEPLHGQRLQNTHGGGGGLDYGAQGRAHQNAQNGVSGIHDKVLEPCHILQGPHGGGHGMQSLEQQAEAQNDLADVLVLLLLGIEHQKRPDEDAGRGNAGYIQGDQDAGDGGTDVGAEDHAGGLGQVHDARVDKAHDHDRGSGRGLNDDRHEDAQQKAQKTVPGQLFQQVLHPGPAGDLQSVAHVLHAEQERAQPAQQRNDIGEAHSIPPIFKSV